VHAWRALPPDCEACFDVVLANQVFYYVPNLDDLLSGLSHALASSGLFLAAIAGQSNTLIQFWNHCFALLGKPVPFHTAEAVVVALDHQRVSHRREDVQYQLSFPDSEENRLKILRFLLGSYFSDVPRQAMLDLFEPHMQAGQIWMQLVHEHLVIWRDDDRSIGT